MKRICIITCLVFSAAMAWSSTCSFNKGETLYFDMSGCSGWSTAGGYPAAVFYYQSDATKDILTNTTACDFGGGKSVKIGGGNYITMAKVQDNLYSVEVPRADIGYIRIIRISGEDPDWCWNAQNKMCVDDAGTNNCISCTEWDNTGEWKKWGAGRSADCGSGSEEEQTIEPVDPHPTHQANSDVYGSPVDSIQRGYYNRPYERYEAEEGWCTTNGSFLEKSDDQTTLASEASHQQAVQLINQNSYVAWKVNKAGDGLTIRFSLPDSNDGNGTKGNIAIYAGNDKVGQLELNSYWAWQYCSQTYPNNNPSNGPVIRMKYDEMHLRLSRQVASGETLKVVKVDNNSTPYTIDFVELEPVPAKVTYESLSGDKVQFNGGDLAEFVKNNGGKIIYVPEGKWNCEQRIHLDVSNTQLIGAGMWYTEIYFTASSNSMPTFDHRGIESNQGSNIRCEGLYLNTVNNQRYYQTNSSYQVGKAFMGPWGNNSVIRNCWAEHFECGAWISDYSNKGSNNLLVEHCRFRNNYADGINCSHGTHSHTIRYCSFRNNGDDDMASWSTSAMATNHTFEYCTAENNWRASSLGIFGGKAHNCHHLYIVDALESGFRVNSDFDGKGFSQEDNITFANITVQHCGCVNGQRGTHGDFWGSMQGAVNLGGSNKYDVYNVTVNTVDVIDSRHNAFLIRSGGGHKMINLQLKNIYVNGGNYGILYNGVTGSGNYCNLTIENCAIEQSTFPSSFNWTKSPDCVTPTEFIQTSNQVSPSHNVQKVMIDGTIYIYHNGQYYSVLGTAL